MAAHDGSNAEGLGVMATFLTSKSFLTVALMLVLGAVMNHLVSPRLDPREPPPLKSRIPLIGHLISMIKDQSQFLTFLATTRMPIATLPILNGKLYAIWDAALIQSVYRNKNFSFVPFVIEFARRELNYDDAADKIVRESGLMGEFFEAVHEGMGVQYTNRMNANALKYVAKRLDSMATEGEITVANLFLWCRDLMTMATCEALYGAENPMRTQPSLSDDIWTFEESLPLLLLDIFPSLTARKAHGARSRLQAALNAYYGRNADLNDDVAGITKCRAAVLRKFGVQGSQVGTFELALLHVSTANTIPTLFWFVAYIVTRPDLVERLREEALGVIEYGAEGDVTVNIDSLADKCPLLVSCYREAIRLNNKAIGNRRVMADTTISDGKGNTYLLKEGINVQMPSDPLHHLETVWGKDAAEFAPDRFMDQIKGLNNDTVKAKRASYVPFGGGRHLCPGRNFAFAENLGFMVSFLLGFDVSPVDGNWDKFTEPAQEQCGMASAVCKPRRNGDGFGIRIKRREGWEAKWKFTSGGI